MATTARNRTTFPASAHATATNSTAKSHNCARVGRLVNSLVALISDFAISVGGSLGSDLIIDTHLKAETLKGGKLKC
jgi:hypothetical protein